MRSAFTLIELLVVISIIALLISILLPALRHARSTAQTAVCMSNVRQLAVAGTAYSADAEGYFPHQYAYGPRNLYRNALSNPTYSIGSPTPDTDNWIYNIYPYVNKDKQSFFCPTNEAKETNPLYAPTELDDYGYVANGVVSSWKFDDIRASHSGLVAYVDGPMRGNYSVVRCHYASGASGWSKYGQFWSGWMRFSTGGLFPMPHGNPRSDGKGLDSRTYSFVDGHAVVAPWTEVTSLWFGILLGPNQEDIPEPVSGNYNTSDRTGVIAWR